MGTKFIAAIFAKWRDKLSDHLSGNSVDEGGVFNNAKETGTNVDTGCTSIEHAGTLHGADRSRIVSTCESDSYNEDTETRLSNSSTEIKNENRHDMGVSDMEDETTEAYPTAMEEEVIPTMDELGSSAEPTENDCEAEDANLTFGSNEMENQCSSVIAMEEEVIATMDELVSNEELAENDREADDANLTVGSNEMENQWNSTNGIEDCERYMNAILTPTMVEPEKRDLSKKCGSSGAKYTELNKEITNSSEMTEDEDKEIENYENFCLENSSSDEVSTEDDLDKLASECSIERHESDSDFVMDHPCDKYDDDGHCSWNMLVLKHPKAHAVAKERCREQVLRYKEKTYVQYMNGSSSLQISSTYVNYVHGNSSLHISSTSIIHSHYTVILTQKEYCASLCHIISTTWRNWHMNNTGEQVIFYQDKPRREIRQPMLEDATSTHSGPLVPNIVSTVYVDCMHGNSNLQISSTSKFHSLHTVILTQQAHYVSLCHVISTNRRNWHMLNTGDQVIVYLNKPRHEIRQPMLEDATSTQSGPLVPNTVSTVYGYMAVCEIGKPVSCDALCHIRLGINASSQTLSIHPQESFRNINHKQQCFTEIKQLDIESEVGTREPFYCLNNEIDNSTKQIQHPSEMTTDSCTCVTTNSSTESKSFRRPCQNFDIYTMQYYLLKKTIHTMRDTLFCQMTELLSSLETRNCWYMLCFRFILTLKQIDVPVFIFEELIIVSIGGKMCCSVTNKMFHYTQNIQRCPTQFDYNTPYILRERRVRILNHGYESVSACMAKLCVREYFMPCSTRAMTDDRHLDEKYNFLTIESVIETKMSFDCVSNETDSLDRFDDSTRQIQHLTEISTSPCTSATPKYSTTPMSIRSHSQMFGYFTSNNSILTMTICKTQNAISYQTVISFSSLQSGNRWYRFNVACTITLKQVGVLVYSLCFFRQLFAVSSVDNKCFSVTNNILHYTENIQKLSTQLNYHMTNIFRQGMVIPVAIFKVENACIFSPENHLATHVTVSAVGLRSHFGGRTRQRPAFGNIGLVIKHFTREQFISCSTGSVIDKQRPCERLDYLTKQWEMTDRQAKIHDLDTDGITDQLCDGKFQQKNTEIYGYGSESFTAESIERSQRETHAGIFLQTNEVNISPCALNGLSTNKKMKENDTINLGNTEPIPPDVESNVGGKYQVQIVYRNDGADVHILTKRNDDSSYSSRTTVRILLNKGAKIDGQIGHENSVFTECQNEGKDIFISRSNRCKSGRRDTKHTMPLKVKRAVLQVGQTPKLLILDRTFKDQNRNEQYNECKTDTGVAVINLDCELANLHVQESIIIQSGDDNVCVGVSSQHLKKVNLNEIMSQAELFHSVNAKEGDTAMMVCTKPSKSLLERIRWRRAQETAIKQSVSHVTFASTPDIGNESDLECDITRVPDEPFTSHSRNQSVHLETLKEIKVERCSDEFLGDELCFGAGPGSCSCHQLQPASNQRCKLQTQGANQYSFTNWEEERKSVQNIVYDRLTEMGFVETLESVGLKLVYHLSNEVIILRSEVLDQANVKVFVKKAVYKGLQGLKLDVISDFDPALDLDVEIVQCGYI